MLGAVFLPSGNSAVAVGLSGRSGVRYGAIWEFRGGSWKRENGDVAAGHVQGRRRRRNEGGGRAGYPSGPVFDPRPSDQNATVWTLVGGRWRSVCGAECGDGVSGGGHHGQTMYDVVARGGGGFVAVGYDLNDADLHFDAAVWTSPDGLRWSRAPNDGGALGTGNDFDQVMNAVTETPSGLLVAVGRDRGAGAVWTSTDGAKWTRISIPADPADAKSTLELRDVVFSGSRLVAVGRRGDTSGNSNEAAVWLSDDDGRSWRRVPSPVFEEQSGGQRGGRGQQMRGVVSVPFGFVAVGADHPSGPDGPSSAAMWTSLEGEFWTPVSSPSFGGQGNYLLRAVASASDNIVAVGAAPAPSDRKSAKLDAAVWWTPPER